MNTTRTPLPDTFDELTKIRPLRPIRDDADLSESAFMVLRLNNVGVRTKDQDDYIDVLYALMKKYEDEHERIDLSDLTQLDVLKYLMDLRDMTASDLGRVIGHRTMGHKILKGERGLSKANILALAKFFHVSPGLFMELKPGTKPKKKAAAKPKAIAAKTKKAVRKPAKKRTAAAKK